MLRVKIGVQLDADMVVGPNCDKLFGATAREVNAGYVPSLNSMQVLLRFTRVQGHNQRLATLPSTENTKDYKT